MFFDSRDICFRWGRLVGFVLRVGKVNYMDKVCLFLEGTGVIVCS